MGMLDKLFKIGTDGLKVGYTKTELPPGCDKNPKSVSTIFENGEKLKKSEYTCYDNTGEEATYSIFQKQNGEVVRKEGDLGW